MGDDDMDKIPDSALLKRVNEKLGRAAGSQSRVTASVRQGDLTLAGLLQYEIQRQPLVRACTSVPGIRRVIDQMKVQDRKRV
jgi:osmotically-inducible protein OsmY